MRLDNFFLIILLINDGKTYQQISELLPISYTTVAYWAIYGDPQYLNSFCDKEVKIIFALLQSMKKYC